MAKLKKNDLFARVVKILDDARGHVLRAVNNNMVIAYWLIGREIVQEIQRGKERAKYGEKVIEDLSALLTERYGLGFSPTTLQYFRKFYLAYPQRCAAIPRPLGVESSAVPSGQDIPRPMGVEFLLPQNLTQTGKKLVSTIQHVTAATHLPQGFSSQLSWSHYRALMRVENEEARNFYGRETVEGGWDKRTLERQIHSYYYERILKSRKSEKMLNEGRHLPIPTTPASEELKHPYVLEFLGLPQVADFYESDLERAIISHLQRFLLELGSGFAFVARQKHIRIGDDDRYIDLVFYHCKLKFYLLIDLKVGELTHADVGQMDGYVRMYDDLIVAADDNPTIGLILCTEKNETAVRYSVLKDRKQIFASKYMLCLPTEEQLRLEIEKERHLIDSVTSYENLSVIEESKTGQNELIRSTKRIRRKNH